MVTGAAGRIGALIVQTLRAHVTKLAVADRVTEGIVAEAHLPGDLMDGPYCDGFASAAPSVSSGLDIVIKIASVIARGPVTETSDADGDLSMGFKFFLRCHFSK